MFNFHFQNGTQPLACDFAAISKVYETPAETINRRYLNDEEVCGADDVALSQCMFASPRLRSLYFRIATCTGVA